MNDEQLKEGFAKLRRHDARRAPSFEEVRQRRVRARSAIVIALPIATTFAAAAAVVLWLNVERDEAASTSAASPAPAAAPAVVAAVSAPPSDPAPLDFLLTLPGRSLLASAPSFDQSLLQGRRR